MGSKKYKALDAYATEHRVTTANDLDDDGCIRLATTIVKDARDAYIYAKIYLERHKINHGEKPDNPNLMYTRKKLETNLKLATKFFNTTFFNALTLGKVSPDEMIAELDEIADKYLTGKKKSKLRKIDMENPVEEKMRSRYVRNGGIIYNGEWYPNMTVLCEKNGRKLETIKKRMRNGETLEKAMSYIQRKRRRVNKGAKA